MFVIRLGIAFHCGFADAQAQAPNAQPQYKVGDRLSGNTAAQKAGFREINWDALIPAGWDPAKDLRALLGDGGLVDGDRRANQALEKLREIWDSAPVNDQLNGASVKLPGFVVPLDESRNGLREFLLVPYFGACIHAPPPPANQIIHVLSSKAVKGFRTMDAVWVSGRLRTERGDSILGKSGYAMEAMLVERYEEKPAARR
jgi:hypothetical protein